MPPGTDDQVTTIPPMLFLLVGIVVLFAVVGLTKNSASITRWLCDNSRRLLALQVLSLGFGLFGFVMVGRAGMMDDWSFDRAALAIGGFTIIACGRVAGSVLGRKRRQIHQAKLEREDKAAIWRRTPPS